MNFNNKTFYISGAQGNYLIAFGLSVELVGNKRKTFVGNIIGVPFAIGESILGLVAMAGVKDWMTFQIVISAPFFLLLLLYFILPESPRWLIATGRHEEAKELIEKAAKMNKVKLSPSLLYHEPTSDTKTIGSKDHGTSNIGIMDLFRNPFVRKVTLIMFFNWIVVTLGKYLFCFCF